MKSVISLRIKREDILSALEKLPITEEKRKEILEDCVSAIQKAYGEKPTLFSGKRKVRIVGGLIYLKCREHNCRMTQKKVHPSIASSARWFRMFF